jgi:hypothetical protein
MGIFGSDRQRSGTMGGLLSGLFGGSAIGSPASNYPGNYGKNSGGFGRKLVSGALLAAGAAYLYNRSKNRNTSTNLPNLDLNR